MEKNICISFSVASPVLRGCKRAARQGSWGAGASSSQPPSASLASPWLVHPVVVRPSPADRVPGDRPEDVKVEYPWPRYAESDAWEATTASLSRRL